MSWKVSFGGRERLTSESGFSAVELIAVMAILFIVLMGLTDLFTSGTNAEVDQNNRVQAQQQARVGLDKLRREAHCASATTVNSTSSITLTLPGWCTRTTLSGAVTLPSGTITVQSTAGFASGSNTISFANSTAQTSLTCTGTTATSFTGCSGGDAGTYPSGAIVTNTTASTVTWCIPTSGAGSSVPYSLVRFVGACGAASSGVSWAASLVSNSIFAETVVPVASVTVSSTGGTLTEGTYYYDVTAMVGGVEVPGTVTAFQNVTGTTNSITVSWSAYPGATSYNVYGRDPSGLRLLRNVTTTSFTDLGPTTTTDNPLTLPSATINVVSTAAYNQGGANTIVLGPSGSISCTGTTATSFTGCSGGLSGSYPLGMTVQNASTQRPPNLTLNVTLWINQKANATSLTNVDKFKLVDNISLRNSRPF